MKEVWQIAVSTGCRWIDRGMVQINPKQRDEEFARIRSELKQQGWPQVRFQ